MIYKLSDIMDIIGGGTPKTSNPDYWDGDIPWLSVKDFNNDLRYVYNTEKKITKLGLENSSTKFLDRGDMIISARGTVGEIASIPYPMTFNQSCYGLRAKKNIISSDYLYYLIKYNVGKLQKKVHGSVFDTITRETFSDIEVDIPRLEIQNKIVSVLCDIDAKIQLNVTINRNLYEQAVALFEAMYQGYPVKKIGELDIFVTDYVANGSFASLKENVIILEEKNYAYFIRNVDLKAKEFPRFVNQNSYEFLSKSKLVGGEVIISNVGDVGSVFLCPKLDGPMTLGNNMIMLTSPKHNNYLYLFFKSYIGQGKIGGITGGSAQPKFNKTDFKSLEINYPDESQVDEFNEKTSALLDMISKLDEENKRLTALRDSLLTKLMSGELNISDLDI